MISGVYIVSARWPSGIGVEDARSKEVRERSGDGSERRCGAESTGNSRVGPVDLHASGPREDALVVQNSVANILWHLFDAVRWM
jgi:hypothetical protein